MATRRSPWRLYFRFGRPHRHIGACWIRVCSARAVFEQFVQADAASQRLNSAVSAHADTLAAHPSDNVGASCSHDSCGQRIGIMAIATHYAPARSTRYCIAPALQGAQGGAFGVTIFFTGLLPLALLLGSAKRAAWFGCIGGILVLGSLFIRAR